MTKEQMEQILLENMQKIYLYCVRRLGNATEAEDVASDVVVELLRSYDKVKEDDAVYGRYRMCVRSAVSSVCGT